MKKNKSKITTASGLSIRITELNEFELPFKEWDDQEVNAEKWDQPTTASMPLDKSRSMLNTSEHHTPVFQDLQKVHLPYNIVAFEWKRPIDIFPNNKLVVYDPQKYGYPNLKDGSKHLLHSDLVRHFISTIDLLIYLSYTGKFTLDPLECKGYYPVTKDEIWQPWHHIYSRNSCGSGGKHLPQINDTSKYIVRLFWMGTWRKVYVDDRIPVDKLGHLMLPSNELTQEEKEKRMQTELAEQKNVEQEKVDTVQPQLEWIKENHSEKKHGKPSHASNKTNTTTKTGSNDPVELWPMLLFKALLKLASLTWHDRHEIVDFDILHCLTGWLSQKIRTPNFTALSIWEMIHGYTDQYTFGSRVTLSSKRGKSTSSKNSPKSKSSKSKSKQSGGSNKGSKPGKEVDEKTKSIPLILIANCSDLRNNEEVPEISPCWKHSLLIDQTRDLPLIEPPKYDFPLWKHFRWIKWAISQGLLPPEDTCKERKCYKIVSPFRRYAETVTYRQPTDECLQAQQRNAARADARQLEEKRRTMYQLKEKKKKGKKGDKVDKKSKESKSSKTSAKSKSSKTSQKSKGKKNKDVNLDISFWTDYEKISENIESIVLYFIPREFQKEYKIVVEPLKYIKVTDPQQNLRENVVHSCTTIKEIRNEPWYMFTDSLDYKIFVFSLSDPANLGRVKKSVLLTDETQESVEEDPCLTNNLFYRVKKYYDMEIKEECSMKYDPENIENTIVRKGANFTSLVVTKYNWQEDKIGKMVCYLGTLGTNTVTLEVPPGRHLFQLWIRNSTIYSPYFYCNVLSNTEFVLGTFPVVLEAGMQKESHRLTKYCYELAENYGQLVQSFGLSEFKDSLRQFYLNYSFGLSLNKKDRNTVYDRWYQIFYETIKESLTGNDEEILKDLRILFLKLELPSKGTQELIDCFNLELNDDDLIYYKIMQRSACKLQAFFKSCYVRLLKARHNPKHAKYMKIFDNLRTLYVHNFSVDNRMKYCPNIWRKFFYFLRTFSDVQLEIYEDLNNTVTTYEFQDTISVSEGSWVPFCQYVFFVNAPTAVPVKINLITDIEHTYVQVFDNDTNQELKRYTNNVATCRYNSNLHGYTVFCYGYPKFSGSFYWRIIFVTCKEIKENLLIIPTASLNRYTIVDYYIPNKINHLFTYQISIKDNAAVSFRLIANYKSAELLLKISDFSGKKVREISGGHALILAGVYLESENHFGRFRQEELETSSKATLSGKKIGSGLTMRRSSRSAKRMDTSSKKSAERASRKSESSQNVRKKNPKNISSIPEDGIKKTVYFLAAYVNENSWDLTQAEWDVILKIKESRLLKQSTDMYKIKGIRANMGVPFRNFQSSIELVATNKSSLPEQPPFWTLEIICDESDDVSLTRDTTKEDHFKTIVNNWFKDDPERKDKGLQLRQQYLDENAGSELKSIDQGGRSPVPAKITQNWKPFNLQSYYLSKADNQAKEETKKEKKSNLKYYFNKLPEFDDVEKEPKEYLVLKDSKTFKKSKENLTLSQSDFGMILLNEVKESLMKLEKSDDRETVIKTPHGDITVFKEDLDGQKNFNDSQPNLILEAGELLKVEEKKDVDNKKEIPVVVPTRELKTVKEIQEDVESLKTKCEEYDKLIEESRKNISQYVETELAQSGNLYDWFKDCQKESAEIMNYAYDLRERYIKSVLRVYEKQKSPRGAKKKKKKAKT